MPACRQCGKDNAEGMVFCGYCATPLARPTGNPASPQPRQSGNLVSPPQLFKPEIRTPVFHTPPPPSGDGKEKGKSKLELLLWSELSLAQRAGRSIAALVVLLLIFIAVRVLWSSLRGATSGTSENAPSAENSGVPVTEGDRKDGIESLCKVFQIYGMPKNDHDATEAARNAAELFKLAGDQSRERSAYILTTIVREFRSGKLSQPDCAEAGAPVGTTQQGTDNSTPDVNR